MLLDDIADLLSSASVGTIGTTLFKGTFPSEPAACVGILEYGGLPPVWTMSSGPPSGRPAVERPRFQVLSRDDRSDGAQKRARDAKFALDGYAGTKNGVRYQAIWALQEPFFYERDKSNREVFVCNFEAVRNPATSS